MTLQEFISVIQKTFGCFESEEILIPEDIKKLAQEREKERASGEYEKSDALRKEILERGFVLEDQKGGPKIVPKERRG